MITQFQVILLTVTTVSAFVNNAPITLCRNNRNSGTNFVPGGTASTYSSPIFPKSLVNAPNRNPFHRSPSPSSSVRSLHVLESAKIVPYAFRSLSAALTYRAVKEFASNKMDALILFTTAMISFFTFADGDNALLISTKRATKRIKNGKTTEEEAIMAAKKWKTAVRVKIFGQFLSLIWMANVSGSGIMRSAAAVVFSTVIFLFLGGGRFRHNGKGLLDSIPSEKVIQIYIYNFFVMAAALMAASLSMEASVWRMVCAGYVAFDFLTNAIEGIRMKTSK